MRLSSRKRYQLIAGGVVLGAGLLTYAATPGAITGILAANPAEFARNLGIVGGGAGGGTYLEPWEMHPLSLVLVPLAVATVMRRTSSDVLRPLLWWTLWTALFVGFQLLAYRRFLIHLDVALMVLAAPTVADVSRALWSRRIGRPALVGLVGIGVLLFGAAYVQTRPLMSTDEMASVHAIEEHVPADAVVVVTDSFYAPWIFGYADRAIVAPGLFEFDQWSASEWELIWNPPTAQERYALLDELPTPLFVYVGQRQRLPTLDGDARFEQIAVGLWRYVPAMTARRD